MEVCVIQQFMGAQVPAELTECSQGSSNGVYGICPALSSKVAGAPLMLATQLRCPAHHAETLYLSQLILRKRYMLAKVTLGSIVYKVVWDSIVLKLLHGCHVIRAIFWLLANVKPYI